MARGRNFAGLEGRIVQALACPIVVGLSCFPRGRCRVEPAGRRRAHRAPAARGPSSTSSMCVCGTPWIAYCDGALAATGAKECPKLHVRLVRPILSEQPISLVLSRGVVANTPFMSKVVRAMPAQGIYRTQKSCGRLPRRLGYVRALPSSIALHSSVYTTQPWEGLSK